MLTIKAEIRKGQKRSDGSFNVKLRFTMNRRVIRKSTEFYVQSADLTSNLTLRDGSEVKVRVDSLVVYLQKRYVELSLTDTSYSLEEVISILYSGNEEKEGIDFIKFSENWIANTDVKGAKNYQSAINAFKEYLGKDTLEVQLMDRKMLLSFCQYLRDKHQKKAETLIKEGKRVPSERASSLYLGSLRHLFKEAKLFYNDYDRDIIRITNDPFQNFTVPQQNATRKRTLPKEKICKISKLPYKTTQEGRLCGRCAYNLAKDCFILSFS